MTSWLYHFACICGATGKPKLLHTYITFLKALMAFWTAWRTNDDKMINIICDNWDLGRADNSFHCIRYSTKIFEAQL